MKVQDIMTSSVYSAKVTDSIAEAARVMADNDVGALPIVEGRQVLGIVTDRDIAVRAVAGAIGPDLPVKRIMTENVVTCSAQDEVEDMLGLMSNEQIRRLPVCKEGELIGIVTLADAAGRDPNKSEVGETLAEICEPSGLHSQAPVFA